MIRCAVSELILLSLTPNREVTSYKLKKPNTQKKSYTSKGEIKSKAR